MSALASISLGKVMHARHMPRENRFSYAMFTLCLPLSALESIRVPMLGINCFNLLSFHEKDHGRRDGSSLKAWIGHILQSNGISEADGEVVLQAMPRLLCFVFNPVSFWYCHDRNGALRAVLCEVCNTFGERHNYLVAHADRRPIGADEELVAQKVFHVSPFFPVRGEYHFRFAAGAQHRVVSIDYWDEGKKVLSTRMAGEQISLTGANLGRALLRCPMLTFGVVARINWQALRLIWRRIPWLAKPQPPLEETT